MSLCQTYRDLSFQTWRLMEKARSVSHQPLEETITDNNIIELKLRQSHEVITTTYNKVQEGKIGADWQWWFTNSKKNIWFGVRVQAKILKFKTNRFEVLNYKNQTDVLIKSAQKDGLIPLYCFYSQWPLSKNYPTKNCLTFPNAPESYGCSIIDAYTIKKNKKTKKSNTLASVISDVFPWSCLVCCQSTTSRSNANSLPDRVKSFVQNVLLRNSSDDILIPKITKEPPRHIKSILDKGNENHENDDPNLAGVIVIIESDDQNKGGIILKQGKLPSPPSSV